MGRNMTTGQPQIHCTAETAYPKLVLMHVCINTHKVYIHIKVHFVETVFKVNKKQKTTGGILQQ